MILATGKTNWPIEVFSLLLLVIFTTELAVMELFGPLFKYLDNWVAALADATLLAIISVLPLWAIFSPVFQGQLRRDAVARKVLVKSIATLISGFALIELLVMLFLPGMLRESASLLLSITNAGVTALLSTPIISGLLTRMERNHYRISFTNLLESPQTLFLLLLYVVFLSALLMGLIVPEDFIPSLHGPTHFLEALVLMLVVSPFLWLFVARPLRRSLQSERTRAQAIYEQVIDAVILANGRGVITALNPAARNVFGYTEAELLGRPVALLFDKVHSPDVLFHDDDHGFSKAGGFREVSGWHRSGRTLTLEVSTSRIVVGGLEDCLLIMRDIGAKREAERALRESDIRFREVFEQSEDAILFVKPGSDYIVDVNRTTEQLFGYSKAEMQGGGLAHLFRGKELLRIRGALAGMDSQGVIQFDQLNGLRADGSECIISLRLKAMMLQGVPLIYGTLRDITDRVRLEQKARDIQSRLIQANKMTSLGLLVSSVAHEVNNPNNLIMTNAQLLAGGLADTTRILKEYARENGDFSLGGIPFSEIEASLPQLVNGIIDGSQRIARIVGELKSYARTDLHGVENAIDINQVVTAAISILQHELSRSTERFQCELAGNLPVIVGNSQQLGQVVINLLINACQALPSRQHGIRLATSHDPVAGQVVITVTDEGSGIPPEVGRRIMEPFFTTRLDRGGTGLGLSICHSIVTEHAGILEYSSQPGHGSTFTVKLPTGSLPVMEEI